MPSIRCVPPRAPDSHYPPKRQCKPRRTTKIFFAAQAPFRHILKQYQALKKETKQLKIQHAVMRSFFEQIQLEDPRSKEIYQDLVATPPLPPKLVSFNPFAFTPLFKAGLAFYLIKI